MVTIMEQLQQYVPTHTTTHTVQVPGSSEPVHVTVDDFHYILMGGDQLTAARARGSQRARCNSQRPKDRLEGLQPVAEDWHAKLCLLGVNEVFNNIDVIRYILVVMFLFSRSYGGGCTTAHQVEMAEPCFNCATSLTAGMW